MPQRTISKSCFNLVTRFALRPFAKAAGQADGSFVVDVSDEDLATVDLYAQPGETFSDAVERRLSENLR